MRSIESLSHTRWEYKYHVVFIPKYRKKAIFGQIRKELGEVFRRLARQKESVIERRASDAGSCAHDDLDSTEVCGVAGDRIYQRKERDPYSPDVRGQKAELRRREFNL
jgi:putative transposase